MGNTNATDCFTPPPVPLSLASSGALLPAFPTIKDRFRRLFACSFVAELLAPISLLQDPFHYEPVVYEVMNNILLGKLCPSTLRWRCQEPGATNFPEPPAEGDSPAGA